MLSMVLFVMSTTHATGVMAANDASEPKSGTCLSIESGINHKDSRVRKYIPESIDLGDFSLRTKVLLVDLECASPEMIVSREMALGSYAFAEGNWTLARRLFDSAINTIEKVFGSTAAADKAIADYYNASVYPEFLGEPFERAVVYYYRGLLSLQSEEYEHAGAMFAAGQQQDAMAWEGQSKSDFHTLSYLEGWAAQCAGDPGKADIIFTSLERERPDFFRPAKDDRILMIGEYGSGARKQIKHNQSSHLEFTYLDRAPRVPVWIVNNEQKEAMILDDLVWQARTRDGEAFNTIYKGQPTPDSLVDVPVLALNYGTGDPTRGYSPPIYNSGLSAGGNLLVGLVTGIVIGAITHATNDHPENLKAASDYEMLTQRWSELPRYLSFLTDNNKNHDGEYTYSLKPAGRVNDASKLTSVHRGTRCDFAWVSSRSIPYVGETLGITASTSSDSQTLGTLSNVNTDTTSAKETEVEVDDMVSKLRAVNTLLENGLITEEEAIAKRKKLLADF